MRRLFYIFSILSAACLFGTKASAQIVQYKFLNYNSNNGLSQNSVYSIDQDSIGRLWIATANDINIWDGHEFYMYSDIFKGSEYLKSKNISQLCLYKDFCLVITDFGFEIINTKKEEILSLPNFKKANCFDINKDLLYVASDSLIFVFNLISFDIQDTIKTHIIIKSLQAFDEFIYIYGEEQERIIFDLITRLKHSISNCFLKKVKYNKTHIPLVVHTPDMKLRLPNYIISKLHFLEIPNIDEIRSFYLHKDKIWISKNDELYIYQTETGKYLKVNKQERIPEFSRMFVYDFFTDYKDNLYIMTNINGFHIYSYDNNKFIHIKHPKPEFNMVKSIHVLSDSTIVAGLYSKGIIFFNPDGSYSEFFHGKTNTIWDLEPSFESNDIYYAVSNKAIYCIKGKKLSHIARSKEDENYYFLHKGFETYFLYLYDDKKLYIIHELDKYFNPVKTHILNEHLICLKQINQKHLLISLVSGVYLYELNSGVTKKLIEHRAQAIDVYNNEIYVSTNDGLFILDKRLNIKKIITKKSHGITDNFIYYSVYDKNGNLWMANNKGLSVLMANKKRIRNFDLNDGLQANEFNTNAYCYYNGNLIFGGVNGINIIPNILHLSNTFKPNVYHTNMLVDDEIKIENNVNKIVLNYSNNTISLNLRHINFTNRAKSEYLHRLLPTEKSFVNTGSNNFIRYTNLPQGKYTFQYYVENQYGVKSDIKSLSITILPPFWKTWWFYTLITLAVLIMVSGFIIYLYEKNRQKILLKYEVQKNLEYERMRISRDLHDNVGAQLSYLISQIEILHSKYSRIFNDDDKKNFIKLENISREAIQTIRETIWLLNSKDLTLEHLIDKTKQYILKIKDMNEQVEVEYYENVDNSKLIPPATAINLFRIIQEALTNSFKHSKCSRIKVYFETYHNDIYIRIYDDGVGFDINTEFINHYGLKNMKVRADEIKASIVIHSEKLNGSSVEIKLSLQQMQYLSKA